MKTGAISDDLMQCASACECVKWSHAVWMLEPVCVIWSQVVSSSVLAGGKFRVIMQYMEPHCIV